MLKRLYCQLVFRTMARREGNIHCNAHYAVSCIPETYVASVRAAFGRVPWHDDDEDLNENEKYGCDIPGLELGRSSSDALVVTSDDVETNTHCQKEQAFGVGLETHDWLTVSKGKKGIL